jgi:hypothetical protein
MMLINISPWQYYRRVVIDHTWDKPYWDFVDRPIQKTQLMKEGLTGLIGILPDVARYERRRFSV